MSLTGVLITAAEQSLNLPTRRAVLYWKSVVCLRRALRLGLICCHVYFERVQQRNVPSSDIRNYLEVFVLTYISQVLDINITYEADTFPDLNHEDCSVVRNHIMPQKISLVARDNLPFKKKTFTRARSITARKNTKIKTLLCVFW